MISARVKCLCRQMHLPELDLSLRQGETGWVPEAQARASDELKTYVRQGALFVEYLERVVDMSGYPAWPRGTRVLPNRDKNSQVAPLPSATVSSLAASSGVGGAPSPIGADAHQALLKELRLGREVQQVLLLEIRSMRQTQDAMRQTQEKIATKPSQTVVASPAKEVEEDPMALKLQRGVLREMRGLRETLEKEARKPTLAPSPAPASAFQEELLLEIRGLRKVCEDLDTAIQTLAAQQKSLPASMLGAVHAFATNVSRKAQFDLTEDDSDDWGDVEDAPIFIPTGLVDSSQSVTVESAQDSASEDLEDSVAQLRALKGASRRNEE